MAQSQWDDQDYYYYDADPQEYYEHVANATPPEQQQAKTGQGEIEGSKSWQDYYNHMEGSDSDGSYGGYGSGCGCGGGHHCKGCPCKDELCDIKEQDAVTLSKTCTIMEETGEIGNKVCAIEEGVDHNNALLMAIYERVCENQGSGDQVIVNCGECCGDCPACDSCCPECPEVPPPGGPDPDFDFCLPAQAGNQLEDGEKYLFSQYGITKRGWKTFFLTSSAMNDQEAEFEDKYHGWSTTDEPFTRGLFMLRNLPTELEVYTEWTYRTEWATANLLEGG